MSLALCCVLRYVLRNVFEYVFRPVLQHNGKHTTTTMTQEHSCVGHGGKANSKTEAEALTINPMVLQCVLCCVVLCVAKYKESIL